MSAVSQRGLRHPRFFERSSRGFRITDEITFLMSLGRDRREDETIHFDGYVRGKCRTRDDSRI